MTTVPKEYIISAFTLNSSHIGWCADIEGRGVFEALGGLFAGHQCYKANFIPEYLSRIKFPIQKATEDRRLKEKPDILIFATQNEPYYLSNLHEEALPEFLEKGYRQVGFVESEGIGDRAGGARVSQEVEAVEREALRLSVYASNEHPAIKMRHVPVETLTYESKVGKYRRIAGAIPLYIDTPLGTILVVNVHNPDGPRGVNVKKDVKGTEFDTFKAERDQITREAGILFSNILRNYVVEPNIPIIGTFILGDFNFILVPSKDLDMTKIIKHINDMSSGENRKTRAAAAQPLYAIDEAKNAVPGGFSEGVSGESQRFAPTFRPTWKLRRHRDIKKCQGDKSWDDCYVDVFPGWRDRIFYRGGEKHSIKCFHYDILDTENTKETDVLLN